MAGVSAGLFGTNDNEAGNEWILPNHSFTDNVQEFTQSWQVTKGFFLCRLPVVLKHKGQHATYCFGLDELNLDSETAAYSIYPVFNQGKGCMYLLKNIAEFPVDRR